MAEREPTAVLVLSSLDACRGPLLAELLRRAIPGSEIRTAGTSALDGDPATWLAQVVADDLGLDLRNHRAHRLVPDDLEAAHLVVPVEDAVGRLCIRRLPASAAKITSVGSFPRPAEAFSAHVQLARELADAAEQAAASTRFRVEGPAVGPPPVRGMPCV